MIFKVLRHKDFRNLWLGQAISQFGDAIYNLLFIFMADRITHNPQFVGVVAAAAAAPYLFLSPIAGLAADRYDRKKIMMFCDCLSALTLAGFAFVLFGNLVPPLWSLVAVPALLAIINVFFAPARGAAIANLVSGPDLMSAHSLSSATLNTMHTVGLMLAALILGPIESINPQQFFLIAVLANMLTFLGSVLFISRLPAIEVEPDLQTKKVWFQEIAAGFQAVRADKLLKYMMLCNIVVAVTMSGFTVVYSATNRAWFDGKFSTLVLVELGFLIALIIGSFCVPQCRIKNVGLAFSLGLATVGLGVAIMAWTKTVPLFFLANFICGIALPFANIPYSTYLSMAVPDEIRGRVTSFHTMTVWGLQPLGAWLTGVGVRFLGLMGIYLALGISVMVSSISPLLSREYRKASLPEPEPKSSS